MFLKEGGRPTGPDMPKRRKGGMTARAGEHRTSMPRPAMTGTALLSFIAHEFVDCAADSDAYPRPVLGRGRGYQFCFCFCFLSSRSVRCRSSGHVARHVAGRSRAVRNEAETRIGLSERRQKNSHKPRVDVKGARCCSSRHWCHRGKPLT